MHAFLPGGAKCSGHDGAARVGVQDGREHRGPDHAPPAGEVLAQRDGERIRPGPSHAHIRRPDAYG